MRILRVSNRRSFLSYEVLQGSFLNQFQSQHQVWFWSARHHSPIRTSEMGTDSCSAVQSKWTKARVGTRDLLLFWRENCASTVAFCANCKRHNDAIRVGGSLGFTKKMLVKPMHLGNEQTAGLKSCLDRQILQEIVSKSSLARAATEAGAVRPANVLDRAASRGQLEGELPDVSTGYTRTSS